MYKRVYSPEGEPFDVPVERANSLVLNLGWTQTPVVKEQKSAKKSDPAPSATQDDSDE